jgi:hypothetical protein
MREPRRVRGFAVLVPIRFCFPEKLMSNRQDAKRRGEWAEAQFLARAASLGLIVCKPWGESARFDFIVAHASGSCRVQVKSTTFRVPGARSYVCTLTSRGPLYRPGEFDFLAVYVIPEPMWYIIPAQVLGCQTRALFLTPHCSTNKYSKYSEAWHLLSASPAAG